MHFVDAFETGVSETTSSLAEKYNPCRIIRRKNEKKKRELYCYKDGRIRTLLSVLNSLYSADLPYIPHLNHLVTIINFQKS